MVFLYDPKSGTSVRGTRYVLMVLKSAYCHYVGYLAMLEELERAESGDTRGAFGDALFGFFDKIGEGVVKVAKQLQRLQRLPAPTISSTVTIPMVRPCHAS